MGIDAEIHARLDDGTVVCFDTMERYYGPEYPRGNWPVIYAEIRELQARFPGAPVYYGDDHRDLEESLGDECTPAFLESIWQHYLSEQLKEDTLRVSFDVSMKGGD